ncbi:hypothetical protein Tco_1432602 [Tanacetum coccineum]
MSLTPYASETSFSPTLLPLLSSLHQMPPSLTSVNPHSLFFSLIRKEVRYDGSEFDTYLSEFKIRISRSGGDGPLPSGAQELGNGEKGEPFDRR